jgi:hypothetical protein
MPISNLVEADTKERSMVDGAIQSLLSQNVEYERKVHHLRKLRFMKLQSRAPKPFQRVLSGGLRSPLSYRLVQTVVGMICRERPQFKRLPMNKEDRDAASRLQASADPLLQDLERLARKPLYWHGVDALVADGRAVAKGYRDAWTQFPDQGDEEPDPDYNRRVAEFILQGSSHPLRLRMVDTLNFKVPQVEYEPPFVLETGKRPTMGVAESFGLRFGTNNRIEVLPDATAFHTLELPSGLPATIDVEELWTPDTVYVRIAGQVFKADNDLGFIPYEWASGETSSNPDVSLQNLSILYPFAGVEPWLNSMLTILASWGVIGGTPILFTSRKLPPGAGGVPDTQPTISDIPLGKRVDLGIGGEIGFVQPPPVGREVLEFIQFLVQFLDRAGLPEVAYGALGSRTPGTAFQGALEQALAKVNPIVTSAERFFADIVRMQWRITEIVGKPIVVTGTGVQAKDMLRRRRLGRFVVNPRDIHGYYDLHAKLRVGNTQDQISRGMHAAFMRDKKLWSRDRAMEYAGVDDPWDEFKTITRDMLEESPLVQQITLTEALKQEPEIAARAAELEAQGVDIVGLLLGLQPGASPRGAPVPGLGGRAASPAATPAASAPAPRRGGRPTGSPKRPGGPGRAKQGSRGHR